jgi:phosphomannomutase/phosphoglucomutase
LLIPKTFNRIGVKVVAINTEPNGSFPWRPPDPTNESLFNLKRLVLKEKADFGVGYDGDGDRSVFIDEKGKIVPSNLIFVILIKYFLKKHIGGSVVYEVSCSSNVEETIKTFGGKPVLSKVGHTYIFDKITKEKAILGGETSGHFYFSDMYGLDDAFYASLKIAEILSNKNEKLSKLVNSIPKYPRIPSKSYECPDEKKYKIVEKLGEELKEMGYKIIAVDGIKVVNNEGWFLIRPSNTQPLIRLTVEAKNEETLQRLVLFAEKKIKEKIEK